MRALIVNNKHQHYDRIGELIERRDGERWIMRIPHRDSTLQTTVSDQDIKIIKRQTTKGIEFQPDPPGTLSRSGKYQADGLGCVERVSSVERDWLDPAAHRG